MVPLDVGAAGLHGWGAVCSVLAAMFFLRYLQDGQRREGSIRCTQCGSRVGDKHHKDCHYKDRL